MNVKKMVLVILFSQGITMELFARVCAGEDGEDRIFHEPAKAMETQILLGFSQAVAAKYLYSYVSPQGKINADKLDLAKKQLQYAQDLPLSEEQRHRTIGAILNKIDPWDNNPEDLENQKGIFNSSEHKRVNRLKYVKLVSWEERENAINQAKANLAETRTSILKSAQSMGLLDKSLRVLRVGASVLLIGDGIGRVYVWHSLDANPTLSPTATYLKHLIAQ